MSKGLLSVAAAALFFACWAVLPCVSYAGEYVGSARCGECHETEYETFKKHSVKSKSWKSVAIMASDLTKAELEGCYECHTTGYGKGGFVSIESTPQFADVGCETCHGPGAAHSEFGEPDLITRKPDVKSCETCHNESRVQAFGYKPLISSGAH